MGQIWTTLGVQTLFGAPKLRGLITMEPGVHDVCNLAGLCGILMFKMWQCANFQILSLTWPMGMGQFWVPFWGTKITRSHNYGNCASIDLKFGRFLLHNDV